MTDGQCSPNVGPQWENNGRGGRQRARGNLINALAMRNRTARAERAKATTTWLLVTHGVVPVLAGIC